MQEPLCGFLTSKHLPEMTTILACLKRPLIDALACQLLGLQRLNGDDIEPDTTHQ